MPSLITAPPNILGVSVPHPGLLPTSIDNLLINGVKGWAENVGDSLTNLSISFDIDGTSTVIAQIEDPQRALLRSAFGLQRTVITIDGVSFVMAEINKQGPQITLTFEHVVCSSLKDHTQVVSVAADSMSRTAFCEKLVAYEGWIKCALPGGQSPGNAVTILSSGNVDSTTGGAIPLPYSTTFTELETFWDSTGTILGTIGWRRFPLGTDTLVIVSDKWLYTQDPIATIDEDTPGIQSIDFDWDIRKPLGSLTITCNASAWAFPVGSVVAFTPKMGIAGVQSDLSLRFSTNANLPPANGHWLVTDISRSLMSSLATITLDVPNLSLTEVETQPPTSAAAQVAQAYNVATKNGAAPVVTSIPGGMQTGKTPTAKVSAFVNFCLSKLTSVSGDTYVFGAEGPNAYDCSGLVRAAAASIGVNFPEHNSQAMYEWAAGQGFAVSVETAIQTYGGILVASPAAEDAYFHSSGNSGHIAVSLSGGQQVDAKGAAYGIVTEPVPSGFFDLAFILPGISY